MYNTVHVVILLWHIETISVRAINCNKELHPVSLSDSSVILSFRIYQLCHVKQIDIIFIIISN